MPAGLDFISHAATGLLPVLVFLIGLILIDSYKLVRMSAVIRSLLVGGLVAVACFFVNGALLRLGVDHVTLTGVVAPLVEEGLKSLYVLYLIRSRRVGFLVDAAIHGFAIGAGFAFVENAYYLSSLAEANLWTWIVRGFGTAMMHGGATSLLGIVAKSFFDRADSSGWTFWMPGLSLAFVLHSAFNHFVLPPLESTAIVMIVVPTLIFIVFQRSEQSTRTWLGEGFDLDQELLRLLSSEELSSSRVGRYLTALREKFAGELVADMLCLLRLNVELSIRAKGILMMQEAGFEVQYDPEIEDRFTEIAYLEKSIGTTGMLALAPFLKTSNRELWQRQMLRHA